MSRPAVLLTRPRAQSEATAASLVAEGVRVLVWPVLEIAPTGAPVEADGAQALLLTSANAARAAAMPALPALCVGAATAAAARAAGCPVVESANGDAAALAAHVVATRDPAAGPLLFLRGETVAGDLAGALREAGFAVREIVVYAARPGADPDPAVADALRSGALTACAYYSPNAAATFAARAQALGARLGRCAAVAISPAAARPLQSCGFARTVVADRPDGAAMRAAVVAVAFGAQGV